MACRRTVMNDRPSARFQYPTEFFQIRTDVHKVDVHKHVKRPDHIHTRIRHTGQIVALIAAESRMSLTRKFLGAHLHTGLGKINPRVVRRQRDQTVWPSNGTSSVINRSISNSAPVVRRLAPPLKIVLTVSSRMNKSNINDMCFM